MSGMTWRGDVAPSDLSNRSRTKFLGWILVQVLRTVKFPCISCHGDNLKSSLQLCIPQPPSETPLSARYAQNIETCESGLT